MTEGIFALAGVVLGAVLGVAGTAGLERWRHSYVRWDARIDRQAATMREALDAYTNFVLAWSPVANQIALGRTVDILDEAIIAGPPGISHQKLIAVAERVHIDSIRERIGLLVESFMTTVANGTVNAATIEAAGRVGTALAADIGAELRRLEAQ